MSDRQESDTGVEECGVHKTVVRPVKKTGEKTRVHDTPVTARETNYSRRRFKEDRFLYTDRL